MYIGRRDPGNLLPLLLVVALLLPVGTALAAPHLRDGWVVGMSFGVGQAGATDSQGETVTADDGISAQMRFGKMIGQRALLGLEYEGWMIEKGDLDHKFRHSLQIWAVSLTFFPGQGTGNGSGFFLRAGSGVALGGRAKVELFEDPEEGIVQEHADREDEWGWGLLLGAGHEWRISSSMAVGLALNYDYLMIGETWYDTAWFGAATLNLGWYF